MTVHVLFETDAVLICTYVDFKVQHVNFMKCN